MYRLYLFISLLFALTSCLPAIFTAATTSTITVAKHQSIANTIDDITIATKIKTTFIKNNFRKLYIRIKVGVNQGRVLLTGAIEKEEDALNAVKMVWDQPGVIEVINELTVDKNSNYFNLVQYTKDSMITAQIKTKTFLDRNIKFINYTIVTVDNIVYIFGIARSKKELEEIASISSEINGVEKVICHAKINNHDVNLNDVNTYGDDINENDPDDKKATHNEY